MALALAGLLTCLAWPAGAQAQTQALALDVQQQGAAGQPPPRPQPQPQPARPATPARKRPPIGFRAYFLYDANFMAASESFNAVINTSRFDAFGGGGEVLRIWGNLFARVTYSTASRDGERVFVIDDDVFPLGIPIKIETTPVEIAAGWRFENAFRGRPATPARRPGQPAPPPPPAPAPRNPPAGTGTGAVGGQGTRPAPAAQPASTVRPPWAVPYVGGGLLLMRYRETSDLAISGDDVDESFKGFTVFGGIDLRIAKMLFAGFEAQYRGVPDAIGSAGASKAFGETDLGGFTARVLIGIRK